MEDGSIETLPPAGVIERDGHIIEEDPLEKIQHYNTKEDDITDAPIGAGQTIETTDTTRE